MLKRLFQTLGLGLPLLALAISITSTTTDRASAQQGGGAAPVHIVGPLPLPISGATTITGSVQVGNSAQSPLYVVSLNSPTTPYQERRIYSFSGACGGTFCRAAFSAVPPGKRLVITHISGSIILQGGARVRRIYLSESTSGNTVRSHVTTHSEGFDAAGWESRQFSQQTLLYVEAGNQPEVSIETSQNPGAQTQEITLAGYFTTVP